MIQDRKEDPRIVIEGGLVLHDNEVNVWHEDGKLHISTGDGPGVSGFYTRPSGGIDGADR